MPDRSAAGRRRRIRGRRLRWCPPAGGAGLVLWLVARVTLKSGSCRPPATRVPAGSGAVRADHKPNSVPLGGAMIIPLGAGSLPPSSDLPGSLGRADLERSPIWSCSAWGLPSHRRRRRCWCALTAPFHPYPPAHRCAPRGGYARSDPAGGLLSVALSVPSPGLGVTQHAALRSSDFPPRRYRKPGLPRRSSERLQRQNQYTANRG